MNENVYPKFLAARKLCILMHFFDFTQFWLDGQPGNEYFRISHKISDLLTPLTFPGCLSAVFADNQSENEI